MFIGMQLWKVLNIPGSLKCPVPAYASVTQASKYARIWLNNAWIKLSGNDRFLNMPGQSFTEFRICIRF